MTTQRRFRLLTAALLALVLFSGCSGGSTTLPESFTGVAPAQAAEIIETYEGDGFTLIDVRTPGEYAGGYIEGAVNIDFYEPGFAAAINDLDRATQYFVYCRSGNRSAATMELMEQLGFTEVHHLDGGINDWIAAGNPVVVP
jgi:rhodanese-related sulfurtransferase